MKTFTKVLLAISLLGLLAGFSDLGTNSFSGLARAIGAVFFILFFITWAVDALTAEGERIKN